MKPGVGNALLIADIGNASISTDEIRRRWKAGDYGNPPPRADYVKGWMAMAGRKT